MPDNSDASIIVSWAITNAKCWIAIRDSGPGLNDVSSSLFQAGFSQKKQNGNSGFGLFIALKATQSFGGNLILENAKGRGAILRLEWEIS
jgi:sensor histidine kinase regulating citrate/malate metabolism